MSAPAVMIVLELEASPRVLVDVMNEEEARRLDDWLKEAHPAYGDLAERATELAEEARTT